MHIKAKTCIARQHFFLAAGASAFVESRINAGDKPSGDTRAQTQSPALAKASFAVSLSLSTHDGE
jgi:hypothetical protein